MNVQTERLWAEAEIRRVLLRYARGVDRLDLDLVRSCYHPDATDSHGSFDGTVDEFVTWVERVLRRYDATMHFLGNPLIELTDDRTAAVETYGMAFHRAAGGPPERNLVTGFRFVDRFECRRRRVAHRPPGRGHRVVPGRPRGRLVARPRRHAPGPARPHRPGLRAWTQDR